MFKINEKLGNQFFSELSAAQQPLANVFFPFLKEKLGEGHNVTFNKETSWKFINRIHYANSFAQALLITELITGSVRILSCATACQQERNLGLTKWYKRDGRYGSVSHNVGQEEHTHIYLYVAYYTLDQPCLTQLLYRPALPDRGRVAGPHFYCKVFVTIAILQNEELNVAKVTVLQEYILVYNAGLQTQEFSSLYHFTRGLGWSSG